MFFSRKCALCGVRIEKGQGLEEEVEVYGLVDKHKRSFCSEECLEKHKKTTAARMATRGPGFCRRCLLK